MRFIKLLKTKNGSLTLETAVALPAYIFVILGMIFFMRVIYIHGTMQHALNETANIFSNSSYLYTVTLKGNDEKIENYLDDGGNKFEEHLNTVVNAVSSITNAVDAKSNNQSGNVENMINEVAENPKSEVLSVVSLIAKGAYANAKSNLFKPILTLFVGNYLKGENQSGDQKLRGLNVVDGIKGLDFSESKLLADRKNIEIVVRYKIKPIFLLPEIYIIQRSYARAWQDGELGSGLSKGNIGDNVWDLKPMERGKEIQRREGRNLPEFFPVIAIFKNSKATSIKSIDLGSKTYMKPENIRAKILEFITELSNFKDGTYLNKKIKIKSRELIIVVPESSINSEIAGIIKECETIAAQSNIKLIIKDCYGKKSEEDVTI